MEGHDGDYNWISWDGDDCGCVCAIGYDAQGEEDWSGYNDFYSLNLFQNDPKLKIQNLSGVDYQKWSKGATLNLRAAEKTPVMILKTQKQNMVNLQNLLVNTKATTPMNLSQGFTPVREAFNLADGCTDTHGTFTDTGGDNCDWYSRKDNYHQCGFFNDEDFNAGELCCACGGGATGDEPSPEVCEDTNGLEVDTGRDGCEWYTLNPSGCGNHDTEFFMANKMCCACGGGSIPAEPEMVCSDTNGELTDSTWDTCTWYVANPSSCGAFDVEGGFNAGEMCCACGGGINEELVKDAFAEGLADLLDANGDDGIPIEEELARLDDDWEHVPCTDDPDWCAILDVQS